MKVRISFLDMNENLLKIATGVVTNGSINIDGASAVRRTCQLSFISTDLGMLDYYEVYKTKFLIETDWGNGFKKQGIFLLTSFSSSVQTNNYTFNISGKDKMCLLNGEHGGSFPFSIDAGSIDEIIYNYVRLSEFEYEPGKYYIQDDNGEYVLDFSPYANILNTYYERLIDVQNTKLSIKDIINNVVMTYGLEQKHNIFLYDLDVPGLELLEYRGQDPLYLYRDKDTGIIDRVDLENPLKDEEEFYPLTPLLDYNPEDSATLVEDRYYVIKVEYGNVIGYRDTDLIYGELKTSINENVVSILDKIKNKLGNYEYFYDENGRFIFQKRKDYTSNQFDTISLDGLGLEYQSAPIQAQTPITLSDIASINQNPQFQNIKNDFSIWGTRSGSSGNLPIHSRIAIHNKPTEYVNYNGKKFVLATDQNEISSLFEDKVELDKNIEKLVNLSRVQISDLYKSNFFSPLIESYFSEFLISPNTSTEIGTQYFYLGLAWISALATIYEEVRSDIVRNDDIKDKEKILLRFLQIMTSPQELKVAISDTGATGLSSSIPFLVKYAGGSVSESFNLPPDADKFIIKYYWKGEEKTLEGNFFSTSYFYSKSFGAQIEDLQNQSPHEVKEFDFILESLQEAIAADRVGWFNKFKADNNIDFITTMNQEATNQQDLILKHQVVNSIQQTMVGSLYQGMYDYDASGEEQQNLRLLWSASKKNEISEILNSVAFQVNEWQQEFTSQLDKNKIIVSDWREILYQMAKDYYENGKKLDFYRKLNQYNSNKFLDRKTGYEAFYEDILGFWRQLYYDPLFESIDYELPVGYSIEDYYYDENDSRNGWHKDVFDNPSALNFWIDFINPQGELARYSIENIGVKGKYENNSQVKSIATHKVPPIKILTSQQWQLLPPNPDPAYSYIQMGGVLENAYTVSAQGISALEKTQNHLFNHTYLQESITLSIIPTDKVKINTRIDLKALNLQGEYSVSKITLPLAYNGMMSVTLVKIPPTLTTEIITKEVSLV